MVLSDTHMRWLDLAVILAYLIGITWFGAQFRSGQKTLRDYFLGGRNAPWWAIGFSIVSAETSTLTVIGTPALAFNGNFGFLQVVFGYLIARLVISVLFLPHYFRGEMYTAYELMQRRFGQRIRKLTAGTFLILRALAEGVRVFAISIVVSIVVNWDLTWLQAPAGALGMQPLELADLLSILLIVALTLFYTFEGGMTAVIWTDVVQMFLYVGGAILSLFVILNAIPGGWGRVVEVAAPLDKFRVFDFSFDPSFTRTYNFWAGLIGGAFLTTASHGTEQLMVQRLLAARNERESRLALFGSWAVIFFQFTLFLTIGVILFVYYRETATAAPQPADRIYPQFIWNHLPHGISGLVIAAILAAAMSNLSAALNSLASTTVMDFYKPMAQRRGHGREHDESWFLALARRVTLVWGVILFVIGFIARQWGSVLEAGLSIASILYGALLGVFLLGILTRRVGERAAMAAMVASMLVMAYVKTSTPIAWTWYVLIGTSTTFATGLLASLVFPREQHG